MKRVIAGILLVATLAACTPNQQFMFWAAKAQVEATEDTADDAVLKAGVEAYFATKAEATAGRPCAEWYDEAIEAGFTPEQWKEPLSRIMYRESHCNPAADNPISTATGLTQILRMWVDDCGGTSLADLEDPQFNLRCARHILDVQGWQAWQTY